VKSGRGGARTASDTFRQNDSAFSSILKSSIAPGAS